MLRVTIYSALVLSLSLFPVIIEIDTQIFVQIMGTLQEGLQSSDNQISSKCCMTLEHLLEFQQESFGKQESVRMAFQQHVSSNPNLFPYFLLILFRRLLFEDWSNIWTLSRPMFGLMCLFPQAR